jgi:hypothetical protein
VEDNFSLERMVNKYIALYDDALKEARERRVA